MVPPKLKKLPCAFGQGQSNSMGRPKSLEVGLLLAAEKLRSPGAPQLWQALACVGWNKYTVVFSTRRMRCIVLYCTRIWSILYTILY